MTQLSSQPDATSPAAPRTAVITGAGSGIGRATALELSRRGWRIALLGRRVEALEQTAALIHETAEAPETLVLPTDVTQAREVTASFSEISRAFGRIDLLFNNAGTFGPAGSVDEIGAGELAQWQATIDTNITGVMLCAAQAFAAMRTQQPQGGRIINNGSVSARVPRPRSVAYTTTKHAVTGLTRSIALDGRRYGITCGQIDIGNAATELLAGIGGDTSKQQPDGSLLVEPTFDVADAAQIIADIAALPASTAVPEIVITAAGMPYDGRG